MCCCDRSQVSAHGFPNYAHSLCADSVSRGVGLSTVGRGEVAQNEGRDVCVRGPWAMRCGVA